MQLEQLRQELDARRDELEQAQRSLSHAKQVRGQVPIKPCHRGLHLPPLRGQSFCSSPRSCHRAEPSPAHQCHGLGTS